MQTAIATKRTEADRNRLQRTACEMNELHAAARERTVLHLTAQEGLVTDDMLAHVQTEKNLLRLYSMVFEAVHPEKSARKFFPEFVGVGERMWDYFNAGAKVMKQTQWVALQKGSGIALYQRWVNIQCEARIP